MVVTTEQLNKWLDIINYFLDEVQEYGERYPNEQYMVNKYDKMIDEMYDLTKGNKK